MGFGEIIVRLTVDEELNFFSVSFNCKGHSSNHQGSEANNDRQDPHPVLFQVTATMAVEGEEQAPVVAEQGHYHGRGE